MTQSPRNALHRAALFVLGLCTVSLSLLGSPPASAQWAPDKTVELVVGTTAGGGQDLFARVMQRIIQSRKLVPSPVAVVNKPGGGGTVGLAYVNQHPADAHYLSIVAMPFLTNQLTGNSAVRYQDFTPISLLYDEHIVFVVRPDSPIGSGKDFIAALQKNPAAYSIAIAPSLGASSHIALGLVLKAAGVDLRKLRVVVFNSAGDVSTALLGKHVDVAIAAAYIAPRLKSDMRALGVVAEQRLARDLASVPTWREQGVNAVFTSWRGVIGPRGLATQQLAYWEQLMGRLAQSEDWKAELDKNLWSDHYLNSRETKALWDTQHDTLRAVLVDLGLAK